VITVGTSTREVDGGAVGPVEPISPEGERLFMPFEKEMCAQSSLVHVHRITVRCHVANIDQSGLWTVSWA